MNIAIIIPAYNEQNRIGNTLQTYNDYFLPLRQKGLRVEFVVVLNGCKDNTLEVVHQLTRSWENVVIINLPQAGKGLAIKAGFADALTRDNDLIGFVDADMATQPPYFMQLIDAIGKADGVIASRYMPGSHIEPQRPWIKRWGSKLVYESLIRLLFGLRYYDYQCGAKLFTRQMVLAVNNDLTVAQWAFDIELLYLAKRKGFTVIEVPTVWYDQKGSKLNIMGAGLPMISSLFKIRWRH